MGKTNFIKIIYKWFGFRNKKVIKNKSNRHIKHSPRKPNNKKSVSFLLNENNHKNIIENENNYIEQLKYKILYIKDLKFGDIIGPGQ